MYKLIEGGVIHPDGSFIPNEPLNRHWQEYLAWLDEDNTPLPADVPSAEQLAKEEEVRTAPLTARQYFASRPAALTFIRLTPAEQEAQIEAMTLAQLKTVVKYLTIAVSMVIKERLT